MSTDYFKKECVRAANLMSCYEHWIVERFYQVEESVFDRKYSYGGDLLHRGFYCPSPVLDIVTGNAKRGTLVIPRAQKKRPTYTYGFDKDGQLVTVSWKNEHELIWREDAIEFGMAFRESPHDKSICYLSECVYEGDQLASYTVFLYHPFDKTVSYLSREIYSYSPECLTVEFVQFSNNKPWLLQKDKIVFPIENGSLKGSHHTPC